MPEGIPYSSSNVVAGAGLELNYVGNHCTGTSGQFTFTDTVGYGLNFTSGSGYIMATAYFGYSDPSGDNIETHVLMNDILMFDAENNSSYSGDFTNGFAHIKFLIPPYTNVKIGAINKSNSNEHNGTILFTGKVYK